jgi:hypothetical protein
MKNVVFWDIKTQFVPHRKYIKFPLQSPAGYCRVGSEVFTELTIENAAVWDIMPCGSCKNRRFEGRYLLQRQGV